MEADAVDHENDRFEDDDVEEIVERSHGAIVGFLAGIALGTVIGAGIMLLSAPQRGAVTRRKMRQRFRNLTDEARDRIGDLGDEASHELSKQRRRIRRRLRRGK